MKRALDRLHTILAVAALIVFTATAGLALDVPRMSKEALRDNLENPDFVVIDTRLGGDWGAEQGKITGTDRRDPDNVGSWASQYDKEKTIVVYCA